VAEKVKTPFYGDRNHDHVILVQLPPSLCCYVLG